MDPNLLFFGLSASEYDSFMRFWLLSYFVALYQHSAHCLRSSHLLLDADIICVMLWLQWVVVKEVGRNTMWWCETWLCIFSNPLKMCQKKVALRLYYYITVWLRWLDSTRRNLSSSLSKLQIGLNISSLHRKYWFDRSLSCYFCVHAVQYSLIILTVLTRFWARVLSWKFERSTENTKNRNFGMVHFLVLSRNANF